MALTKALMYARVSSSTGTGTGLYRKARIGATRLGYFGPKQILSVNSTLRTNNFDKTNWEVTEQSRGQGRRLRLEVFGFTPVVGQEVILGAGSITNRLFRGTITRVRQVRHKLNDGRTVYACQCVDWTYQFANLKVTKTWTSTSATTIAQELISGFAPAGFTSVHVQTGLATLDDFQTTMQTLPSALQQLCERIGGSYYLDADKDLHLYVGTDTTGVNPEALTASNPHVRADFSYESDIEALRNRILVEGMGSAASSQVAAGTTTLPMTDSGPFSASGGEAKLEGQRITYTSVAALAGEGCLTAGTPGSAPNSPSPTHVAPYITGNLTAIGGSYGYLVTFVSALGESDGSAGVAGAIAAVSSGANDGPSSVSGTTGGSLVSNGNYAWVVTFVTAAGEVGHSYSGVTIWSLGVGNTKANLTGIPTSADARVTSRKVYRTINGGTDFKLVTTIGDNVTTTYADSTADASLGVSAPTTDTGSTGKMTVGIPLGPTGTTSRKLYRTVIGGTSYKLQSTTADNTTTSVLDNTADGSLGAAFAGSSIGAGPGDTTLRVTDLSKFPSGGWARAGAQVLLFTGRSATSGEGTLTGIPTSGEGSIAANIPAGTTVQVEPHLTGIPASGAGAITSTISVGDSVNILITANDTTSQGTYGIREDYVQQRGLSKDGCTELAAARLAVLKDPRISGILLSSDPKLAAGRPLTINHATWGLTASVTVQQITIRPRADRPQPLIEAQLASRTLDDLYAQLREIREQLAR